MNVTVQGLRHAALISVNPYCGTLLGWNDLALACVVNHVLGKDDLLEPVEVSLKETNCTKSIYVNGPKFLFEEHCQSMTLVSV